MIVKFSDYNNNYEDVPLVTYNNKMLVFDNVALFSTFSLQIFTH